MSKSELRNFASIRGIELASQDDIAKEVVDNLVQIYGGDTILIKEKFDYILDEMQQQVHIAYKKHENIYSKKVLEAYFYHLIESSELETLNGLSQAIAQHPEILDQFFMSLAQGRRVRAGSTFESLHNSLFKTLKYPFAEQPILNGKPDFVMPSVDHYHVNGLDCIIFTAKRTLRERWKQVTVEGTKARIFFLATIDEKISNNQLSEMLKNNVYIVCPERIKSKRYKKIVNVLNFTEFFRDHLDPAVERWKRNGVIPND